MSKSVFVFLAALVGAVLLPTAYGEARNLPNRVRWEYVPPKNPAHEALAAQLREAKVLERLSEFLSPLRLPYRLTLRLAGCDGDANAYYEDDVVTVCYEYLEYVQKSAPSPAEAEKLGISSKTALVGPTVDVFLHEVGHAVFDILKIPVLGREEDAADLFSAYLLLQFSPEDARKLILGVAFLGAKDSREAQKEGLSVKSFADEHGLPAQRYFNVLCMAYGEDPKTFADALTRGRLPKERAEGCADEYKQVQRAFNRLIRPYVSQKRARRVRAKRWFKFDADASAADGKPR